MVIDVELNVKVVSVVSFRGVMVSTAPWVNAPTPRLLTFLSHLHTTNHVTSLQAHVTDATLWLLCIFHEPLLVTSLTNKQTPPLRYQRFKRPMMPSALNKFVFVTSFHSFSSFNSFSWKLIRSTPSLFHGGFEIVPKSTRFSL